MRLALSMTSCITDSEMHEHFYATLERGFTPINDYLGAFEGPCSVVGSAPSIKETHKELVGDVIAINSAIGYLLDKGIVPKWGVLWDGTEIVKNFAIPHRDITYLVASRCHPEVFKRLEGCKVVVWHAAGDHDIVEVMKRPEVMAKMTSQPLICGGSAGVTRTIYLASVLGYKDIHIFGADSCYSKAGETHINGSLVHEKDVMISIGNNTEGCPAIWYRTTPELCAQVNEYRSIFAMTVCGMLAALTHKSVYVLQINLHVHGESLFKEMHDRLTEQRKALGDERFIEAIRVQQEEQSKLDEEALKVCEEAEKKKAVN